MFRQHQSNSQPKPALPTREVGSRPTPAPKLVWVGQHPRQPITIYPR
jgi:hypothetical protein